MVDEFNAGIALAIITMASPVLIFFVLVSLPSATAINQVSGEPDLQGEGVADSQLRDNDLSYLNDVKFKNSNPEERLRIAYEHSAQSEVNRCLGDSPNKEMCQETMTLLIDSCADSSMFVTACNDHRLVNYRAIIAKN